MINLLPGTAIELDKTGDISSFLRSLFTAGGLVLSQVLSLTGLNTYTVQNWVKRKYVKPPINKKYDCHQFCTIVILNLLGATFSLDSIRRMLDYAELVCESAPVLIYTLFVETLGELGGNYFAFDEADSVILRRAHMHNISDDARERMVQIVKILLLAHFSSENRLRAQQLFQSLDT